MTSVHAGHKFVVAAWGVGTDCAFRAYLERLVADGNPDAAKVAVAVRRLAEAGPPRQHEKGHELNGAGCKKLFELKPGGTRVVWFYGKGRTIVISHMFPKGANVNAECKRAASVMTEYWKEVDNAEA